MLNHINEGTPDSLLKLIKIHHLVVSSGPILMGGYVIIMLDPMLEERLHMHCLDKCCRVL